MISNVKKVINKIFYTKFGQIIICGIFGLALALMFKRVCKDNCVEYYAPYIKDIKDKVFKLEDTCYKYTPYAVSCEKDENILKPYDINIEPVNLLKNIEAFITFN